MTSRSTGRQGGGIDFRREAEEAARAAGLSVDEWARGVLGHAGEAPAGADPTPVVPPQAAGDPMNRILSSLDRLGDRIRALAAASDSAQHRGAQAERPSVDVRAPAPADLPVDERIAAPAAPTDGVAAGTAQPRHSGIDLQRAIEEIARKRDALEKAAARPAQEPRPAPPPAVEPAEIASLRSDVAAIRQSVEAGDAGARLRSLEDGYDEIVRRLDQLRGAIDNPRTVADLVQRLAEIRRLLSQTPTESQLAGLADRIDRIEDRLSAVAAGDSRDVAEISRQVASLAVAVSGLDPAGLVGVIDARLEEVGEQVAAMERRLAGIDGVGRLQESVERQASMLSVLSQRSEQVPRIAHEMERQAAVVDGFARQLEHLPTLLTDFAALRGTVDAEATRTARGLDEVVSRLENLDTRVAGAASPESVASVVQELIAGDLDRQTAVVDDVARRLDTLPYLAADMASLRERVDSESSRTARGIDDLGLRLDDIGDRVARTPSPDELADHVRDRIAADIERQAAVVDDVSRRLGQLPTLASDIAALRNLVDTEAGHTARGLDALIERIDDLGRRVGEVPTAETLAALVEDRITEVARRLESLGGPIEPGTVDLLDLRIAALADKLETRIAELATTPLAVDLPVELSESLARIEARLADDGTADRIGRLEERISGLTAVVEDLDRLAPPDLGALETALTEVRAHLADLTPPSLSGLESEVRTLTQAIRRIESGALDAAQIDRLDRRIGEIAQRLDRRPADEALVEAAMMRLEATLSSALGGEIRRDFADLRTELRGAAERDRSLLIAIGDAVERLASASREPAPPWVPPARRRDGEVSGRAESAARPGEPPRAEERPPANLFDAFPPESRIAPDAAGPASSAWLEIERTLAETAARADRLARAAEQTRAEPTLDDDRPLEPGSGKPGVVADGTRPEPSKADFIAAARRAALSAANPPAVDPRPAGRPPYRPQRRRGASTLMAPVRVIGAHRRVLLTAVAGAAAVVLVVVGGRMALGTFGDRLPESIDLSRWLSGVPSIQSMTAPAETVPAESMVVQTVPGPEPSADPAETPATETPATETVALAEPPAPAPAAGPSAGFPVAPAAEPGALATSAPVAPAPAFGSDTGQPPAGSFTPVAPDVTEQTASLPSSAAAVARALPPLPDGFGPPALATAALGGDPVAAFEVAARLTEGRAVEQDPSAAAAWYRAAADAGLAVAQYRLGSLYEKGQGVTRDMAEAKAWYERAAQAGNAKAMHNLAVLSADGAGGTPDYAAAARWFAAAAENGVRDSQYNLGILYAKGLGVDRDLTLSYKWFAVAAAGGDTDAAKKRDDVAQVLDKEALARARLAVETWSPTTPDPAANEIPAGDPAWSAVPEATAATAVTGDPVAIAQAMLARLGYDPGPADGKMGERTRLAIQRFQKDRGLAETGSVDDALLRALSEQST
jgi:localization factor PodJL